MLSPHITVDARMGRISGIGTYVAELVPRVIARWTQANFTILGDPDLLVHSVPPSPRVRFTALDVPIYSIKEQVALLRAIPVETTLFWAPHFNVPVLYRGPTAVTVHDVIPLAVPGGSLVKRAYARTVFQSIARRARVVLYNSAFTEAEFRRVVGQPRQVATIHLGVSPRWFDVRNLNPPLDGPYFLAVGNVKPHKNLRRLVAAFAQVASTIPHRLVIVGRRDGLITHDTQVEAMAAALGDRVHFTGHVQQEELERYVAGCCALVQPSLYEGFGFPPLEAMACGRAVAVSRAGSLPEVCGPEADYFDPVDVDDIAAALLRRAYALDADGAAASRRRTWVRRFDWDACAAATVSTLARAGAGT